MPTEIERKFLLASAPDLDALRRAVGEVRVVDIEQRYLAAPPGMERRVRRTTIEGGDAFVRTEKRPVAGTMVERTEIEEPITATEYHDAAADTLGAVISKRRHIFAHAGQRFELDQFSSPVVAWLLEIELADPEDEVTLPPVLDVEREVTDDPSWRNAAIARAVPGA